MTSPARPAFAPRAKSPGFLLVSLMFSHPVLFLLAALMTGWVGFGFFVGSAARVAKFLSLVFLAFFVLAVVQGAAR